MGDVTKRLHLKPKSHVMAGASSQTAGRVNGAPNTLQPLFHEHAVPFGNGVRRNSLCLTDNIVDEPLLGSDDFIISEDQSSLMDTPTIGMPGRDDHESNRMQSDGGRDNANAGGLFTKRPSPLEQQSRALFPPAISQSFSYSPVPARPLASFSPPRAAAFPGRAMAQVMPPPGHHHQPPNRLAMNLPESKQTVGHHLHHHRVVVVVVVWKVSIQYDRPKI